MCSYRSDFLRPTLYSARDRRQSGEAEFWKYARRVIHGLNGDLGNDSEYSPAFESVLTVCLDGRTVKHPILTEHKARRRTNSVAFTVKFVQCRFCPGIALWQEE